MLKPLFQRTILFLFIKLNFHRWIFESFLAIISLFSTYYFKSFILYFFNIRINFWEMNIIFLVGKLYLNMEWLKLCFLTMGFMEYYFLNNSFIRKLFFMWNLIIYWLNLCLNTLWNSISLSLVYSFRFRFGNKLSLAINSTYDKRIFRFYSYFLQRLYDFFYLRSLFLFVINTFSVTFIVGRNFIFKIFFFCI